MEDKSCYQCRFYDLRSLVCMYNCRVLAIISESKSAKECNWYSEGKYDIKKLEESNYQ